MSADLLRRAAAAMRTAAKEAEKLYYSPWHDEADEVLDRKGSTVAAVYDHGEINYLTEHIASWHPAVAIAIADWLAFLADFVDASSIGMAGSNYDHALAVARVFLGVES